MMQEGQGTHFQKNSWVQDKSTINFFSSAVTTSLLKSLSLCSLSANELPLLHSPHSRNIHNTNCILEDAGLTML